MTSLSKRMWSGANPWTVASAAVFFCGVLVACSGETTLSDVESPDSGHSEDDLVIARVGDREIKVRDLHHKIKIQLPAMAGAGGASDISQKRQVLQQMLDQYCWVDVAEQAGWDQDQEFLAVLELSRKYILANHASNKSVYTKAEPTDEEIREYYEENPDEFRTVARCKAQQIVVPTREEADAARRRVLGGEDFTEVVKEVSIDRTASGGGWVGTVARGIAAKGYNNRLDINDIILSLGENGISEPVQLSNGWAVFRAYEFQAPEVQPLETVKHLIQETIYKKRSNELFARSLDEARARTGAAVDPVNFARYATTILGDVETIAFAAKETDPATKLVYYRALPERHPASVLAPQGRFMAGFVLAEDLKDFGQARQEFQKVIDNYPNDELVPSAQWMIENMERGIEGDPELTRIRELARKKRKGKGQ